MVKLIWRLSGNLIYHVFFFIKTSYSVKQLDQYYFDAIKMTSQAHSKLSENTFHILDNNWLQNQNECDSSKISEICCSQTA